MALLFSLRDFGRTFATRGRGAELRESVVMRAADESVVILDFADVTNVSYSFADEFVGRLLTDHAARHQVELRNMGEQVDRTVQRAAQRRTGTLVG